MRLLSLLPFLLAGCTTVGTLHNPACVFFCQNNGQNTITMNGEISR